MAEITFTVSTAFLTRTRAALVTERPSLAGQTTAQLNEAARQRIKELIINWVVSIEGQAARQTATNNIVTPTGTDIS